MRESFEEQKKELDVKMAEAKETARLHKKEAAQFQKLKATAEKAKADFISFERKDIKFRGVRSVLSVPRKKEMGCPVMTLFPS